MNARSMKHNKIVTITGLTGAGKDFLAVHALRGIRMPLVNWGTMLGELLDIDRDQMMVNTDPSLVSTKQFEVCDALIDMQPVAVTAHTVRSKGIDIEFDAELEHRLNPSAYVFVSAPAEIIQQRVIARNNIGERASDILSIDDIRKLQDLKKDRVMNISERIGTEFIDLINIPELFPQNIHLLARTLGNIASNS